ncbi:hypothetical protein B0H13DRAFT_1898198 [Mycena leptocephala]|nr:hypothetical protein B0H13DRAFT_1898198 [Mycena leptocephala]
MPRYTLDSQSQLLSHPSRTSRTVSNTTESEGEAEWSASREQHPLPPHAMLPPLPLQLRKNEKKRKKLRTSIRSVSSCRASLCPSPACGLRSPPLIRWARGFTDHALAVVCPVPVSFPVVRDGMGDVESVWERSYEAERECSHLARGCRLLYGHGRFEILRQGLGRARDSSPEAEHEWRTFWQCEYPAYWAGGAGPRSRDVREQVWCGYDAHRARHMVPAVPTAALPCRDQEGVRPDIGVCMLFRVFLSAAGGGASASAHPRTLSSTGRFPATQRATHAETCEEIALAWHANEGQEERMVKRR